MNEQLLSQVEAMITTLESKHTQAELLGDCPLKSLYLELRATRYNLENAPEAYKITH